MITCYWRLIGTLLIRWNRAVLLLVVRDVTQDKLLDLLVGRAAVVLGDVLQLIHGGHGECAGHSVDFCAAHWALKSPRVVSMAT